MEKNQSVMAIREYGRVHVRLREVLERRQMKRNALAKAANTRFEVVDKWFRSVVDIWAGLVWARLCLVLGCGVVDLLYFG